MTILYVVQSAEAQEEAAKQPSGYVEIRRNQTTTIHLPDEGDADLLSSAMHSLYKYTCPLMAPTDQSSTHRAPSRLAWCSC